MVGLLMVFQYFDQIEAFQLKDMRAESFAFAGRFTRMIYRKRSTHVTMRRFILSELVINMKNKSLVEVKLVVLID